MNILELYDLYNDVRAKLFVQEKLILELQKRLECQEKSIERNDNNDGSHIPLGSTYDSNGNELTYKNSSGYWTERTYDSNGNELTYKNSYGFWEESTYDSNGNRLTLKDSDGWWEESTYDSNGNELTFKDSNGKDIKYE